MPTTTAVDRTKPIGSAVVVVGAHSGPNGVRLARGAEAVDTALGGQLLAAYRSAGGSGQSEEVVKIATLGLSSFPLVVVVGLGSAERSEVPGALAPLELIRRAVAAALRSVPAASRVRISIGAIEGGTDGEFVAAVAMGASLGKYQFAGYKSAPAATSRRTTIEIATDSGAEARAAIRRTTILADAIAAARDLVNVPANDMYPQSLADDLIKLVGDQPIEVELLDERALSRRGYRGILAVGRGSARGPRLLRLHYRPARARTHVALVGEGTTYNSGGLNLKAANMSWTKADMAGAAATAMALVAAARRKLPVEITATLPLVENLPSATAFRPSDVVSLRGGRTVEIGDTDASARITLAEAIGRAVEDSPDYLIEASSLTAAQRIALGPRIIAAMGEAEFRDRVIAAGTAAGEALWAMPLPLELRSGLASGVADLSTVPPDRWGAMLAGGAFLGDFVPAPLPWVHLDIAGPAWNPGGPFGYTPKGGTGAGVVTIFAALEDIAAD